MVELYESPLRAVVANHARSVIEANEEIRKNYGGVLGYLQPMLARYDRVFVISEREIQAFLEYQDITLESDRTLVGLLDRMFPGRDAGKFVAHMPRPDDGEEEDDPRPPASIHLERLYGKRPLGSENSGSSKKDYGLMSEIFWGRVRGDGSINIIPGATSLVAGDPAHPFEVGFLMLSSNMRITPEILMSSVPTEFHRAQNLEPSILQQRRRDTAAAVIAHEVGHLVEFVSGRSHIIENSFVRSQSEGDRFGSELFADRMMLAWLPGMHQAGLITDPNIGRDMLDARKIQTFNRLVNESGPITMSFLRGGETTLTRSGIFEHSVGFMTTGGVPHSRALEEFSRVTYQLRDVINLTAQQMCKEGMRGEGESAFGRTVRRIDDMFLSVQEDINQGIPLPQTAQSLGLMIPIIGGMEYVRRMGCSIAHQQFSLNLDPSQSRLIERLNVGQIGPEGRKILSEYKQAVERLLVDNPGPTDERVRRLMDTLGRDPDQPPPPSPSGAP